MSHGYPFVTKASIATQAGRQRAGVRHDLHARHAGASRGEARWQARTGRMDGEPCRDGHEAGRAAC